MQSTEPRLPAAVPTRVTDPARLRPADWVAGFCLLLLCQLGGEILVQAARILIPNLIFPGPVAGILLLLLLLARFRQKSAAVVGVGDGLLGILSLLFVPSAVGIMQHVDLIRAWGLPLLVAVVCSTVLTLLATAGAFIATEKWMARRKV